MFQICTRRRTNPPPPESSRRWPRVSVVAALVLAILSPSCHHKSENANRIKPILADLQIQNPYMGSPDPAVYLDKGQVLGDLVTVNIKLRAGQAPIAFDAFSLEFTYDFRLVQIGDVFDVNPDVLGSCNAGLVCDPLCLTNAAQANQGFTVDAAGRAHFVMGVSARSGCPIAKTGRCKDINMTTCTMDSDCPLGETCDTGAGLCKATNKACALDSECVSGESCVPVADTTLVTLAFIAATTIESPPGSRIELFTNPDTSKHGDCEILRNVAEVLVGGRPIPCVDGNAFMTTSR